MTRSALLLSLLCSACVLPPQPAATGPSGAAPVAPAAGGIGPALVPYGDAQVSLQVPQGWKVTVDQAQGLVMVAQDPARSDGAWLALRVTQAATEDALLDAVIAQLGAGAVVIDRSPLPGGAGKRLVADVTAQGMPLRVGAVAVAGQGAAVVGMLMSRQDAFAGLGGTDLVARVLSTMASGANAGPGPAPGPGPGPGSAPGSAPGSYRRGPREQAWYDDCVRGIDVTYCDNLEPLHRSEKRTSSDDVDPNRPPLAKERILGSWFIGTAAILQVPDFTSSTGAVTGHLDESGTGNGYAFKPNGAYQFSKLTFTKTGTCRTKGFEVEVGAWAFDGRRLTFGFVKSLTVGDRTTNVGYHAGLVFKYVASALGLKPVGGAAPAAAEKASK